MTCSECFYDALFGGLAIVLYMFVMLLLIDYGQYVPPGKKRRSIIF
jgi:hypothetical protein